MPSRKPNKDEELFVDNLNYFLECMGYQNKELCSLLHVNASTVSSYLNKNRRIPDKHRKTISDWMLLSERFLSDYDLRANRKFDFKEYLSLSEININAVLNDIEKVFADEFSYYETAYPVKEQDKFLKPVKRLAHFLETNLFASTYTDERFAERITDYLNEVLVDYGEEDVETNEKFLSELLYLLCVFRSFQIKQRGEDAFLQFSIQTSNITRWVIADLISHKRHNELASFLVYVLYSVRYFGPLLSPNERNAVVQEYYDWLLFINNKYVSALTNGIKEKMEGYVFNVFMGSSSVEA